ncbi:DUF4185 domain-containing protein [Microbacterium sp. ASV49]|uniref:DUF4185 domain-containing protein n=1 Tax=Microbacterium candidum TaxID=3041922 RepID=A0ABT7MTH3_9MICO|nr:DUF4185 domain-containing protein [Microbacterium sp. ASV49]MDL9977746.1 DUF4185 domain-containing protein [Microbacterium sp. ASV49]
MPRERTPRARRAAAAASSIALAVVLGACSAGGTPVDTNPNKPFLLRGVEHLQQIAQLTGPGAINDTEKVAVAGTDLGSMTNLGDKTFFFFGDTFGERDPKAIGGQGGNWRSNVSAYTTDTDPSDGITFDGWRPVDDVGLASPLVEGDHDANDGTGEVTKIPTYGFAVGDTLYISYMSVRHWGAAGEWDANRSALAKSTDEGRTWTKLKAPTWPGDSNFVQVATAHVDEGGTEYVYFWGIPAGRFGSVELMRVPATTSAVEDPRAYSYFAGTDPGGSPRWGAKPADAKVVVDGTIGELSVMWSTYLDRWLMTYSDGGNAYIREGITPWGPWGDPIEMASSSEYPGLYSPYMNPRYVTDGGRRIYFTMSLWGPYNVFWFSIDLDKKP